MPSTAQGDTRSTLDFNQGFSGWLFAYPWLKSRIAIVSPWKCIVLPAAEPRTGFRSTSLHQACKYVQDYVVFLAKFSWLGNKVQFHSISPSVCNWKITLQEFLYNYHWSNWIIEAHTRTNSHTHAWINIYIYIYIYIYNYKAYFHKYIGGFKYLYYKVEGEWSMESYILIIE